MHVLRIARNATRFLGLLVLGIAFAVSAAQAEQAAQGPTTTSAPEESAQKDIKADKGQPARHKRKNHGEKRAAASHDNPEGIVSVGVTHPYTATLGFDYHDSSGDGKKVYGRTYSAKLLQNLSEGRSQYFLLSYDTSSFHINSVSDNVKSGTGAYGQVWKSSMLPGFVFNLGGFVTHSINNYGLSVVNDAYVASNSAGALGGLVRAFPMNTQGTLLAGSNFALSYHKGSVATAYPYVEYRHQCTSALGTYARLTGVASTRDANLNGGNFLLLPAAGVDYAIDDYKLGAKYTHEDFTHQRGDRIGFTLSKSF